MNAEIITIGDELLIGQVVDTNSAYIASRLNLIGIRVVQITSVADQSDKIVQAVDSAFTRANLVICTGGLGPTNDDITKLTLAEYFNMKLIMNPYVVDQIRGLLESRGYEVVERSLKQAELPDGCEVLPNSAGTAQGMWFVKEDKHLISLPGVPYEVKAIWYEGLEDLLKERFPLPALRHFTVLTNGIPESKMADLIAEWENNLPGNIKLAYLPSPGILRLRLTGLIVDESDVNRVIREEVKKLESIIGEHVFGYNDDRPETVLQDLLLNENLTVSTAESCTGGMIGATITSVPGSSAYYKGGVVVYSNEVKTSELSVSPYTLIMNGAVSQPVVEQMADGVRSRFNTDFAVSVSGIAGPDGGTTEKPVGTTWIAVASKNKIVSAVYNFGDERSRNIQKATVAALLMLRKEILSCL